MIEEAYDYETLIRRFLRHEISVEEFERTYLDAFKNEKVFLGGDLFEALDWLFAEVDAYTDLPLEPEDDPDDYIDEAQLRESAALTLKKLKALQ
ncbi:MAG: hypothetical protein H6868_04755 [Rhodospirillales bacterium]|nr:hypothetical protein [Rhodospirillales bacterium]